MRAGNPEPQAGFALLNELSESEIAWLLAEGGSRYCERGSMLVKEGSRIESLYLVLEGVLGVTIGGAGGRELARLGPGQIVGEMSFLEDRPASATVSALEGSQVLAIPRSDLEARLRQDTTFSAHLYRALAIVTSRRLRDAVGQLARWLETEPSVEPETLARWEEVARATQEFKEQILAAGNADESDDSQQRTEVADALREFSATLNRAIGDASPENIDAREELGARVQRELLPYFLKARTPAHMYHKPRGYAGDFLAAEQILANAPEGEAPLGPLLDAAFLSLPVAQALRDSRRLIADELRRVREDINGDTFRVTAIDATPAPELRTFLADTSVQTEATLIEFDDEALVRLRTSDALGAPVRLELETLLNLALARRRVPVDGQDFAYALMLGGALPDRFCIGLLNYLHGLLRPGGWAAVGCLHPDNPDKAFLDHVLGWKLHHRSESEIHGLFRHSLFRSAAERVQAEETGIFFIALCQKA